MRFIFIGDIHGCIEEFQELIRLVDVRTEDRVVCLGDFMDKGPDPVGCVRLARERGFLSILGNHEEKHLKWRRNEARARVEPKYKNGMRPLKPAELEQNALLSDEDIAWLERLPITFEPIPGMLLVHGGLFPGLDLKDQPADKIVRARWVDEDGKHVPSDFDSPDPRPPGAFYWMELYDGPYNVVYGHEAHSLTTAREDACDNGQVCYGIDTGCVHGGRLTAMVVEDGVVSYVQAQAKRVYQEPPWPITA